MKNKSEVFYFEVKKDYEMYAEYFHAKAEQERYKNFVNGFIARNFDPDFQHHTDYTGGLTLTLSDKDMAMYEDQLYKQPVPKSGMRTFKLTSPMQQKWYKEYATQSFKPSLMHEKPWVEHFRYSGRILHDEMWHDSDKNVYGYVEVEGELNPLWIPKDIMPISKKEYQTLKELYYVDPNTGKTAMTGKEKYRLTSSTMIYAGHKLHRIRAIKDFGNVKTGSLGGWIESEANLSHDDDAWVADQAIVYENAIVSDFAVVSGHAVVHGHAKVHNNAEVQDEARIGEDADIGCDARIVGEADITDNAVVNDDQDYLLVRGVAPTASPYTFYRCADGEIRLTSDVFCGTLNELKQKALNSESHPNEYLALTYFVHTHFENL